MYKNISTYQETPLIVRHPKALSDQRCMGMGVGGGSKEAYTDGLNITYAVRRPIDESRLPHTLQENYGSAFSIQSAVRRGGCACKHAGKMSGV